jgi:hypothetical protein
MTLSPPEAALAAVEAYCGSRVPESARDRVRIACSRRGNSITIVEERPPWNPEAQDSGWTSTKVAQLRYDNGTGRWSLHCSDSNGRWWPYDDIAPTSKVDPLLAEIDHDPTGIFWG